MKKVMLKVGDHLINVTSKSESILKIFDINFLMVNEEKKPDIVANIHDGYGMPFTNYEVRITKNNNYITFERADYLIETTSDYKVASVYVHNELALKHALMNLYSSYIVYHNWGILLHSSCALENTKAHIFSGHSGAGKSTAAVLSQPRELLSDEASIVKITNRFITIFNSPFRSEITPDHINKTASLASIQLLNQSLLNKREKLSKADALVDLVDKVFYWAHSPEETKNVMSLLRILISNVPVYKLYFKKDNTFWELIS